MSSINDLFSKVSVINVGLEMFKDDIEKQGGSAVHLDWRPPAGGKPELIDALEALDDVQEVYTSAAFDEE